MLRGGRKPKQIQLFGRQTSNFHSPDFVYFIELFCIFCDIILSRIFVHILFIAYTVYCGDIAIVVVGSRDQRLRILKRV